MFADWKYSHPVKEIALGFAQILSDIREQMGHLEPHPKGILDPTSKDYDEPRKFLAWFLHASSSARSVDEAVKASELDGPYDNHIDAAHIDSKARTVFLVQSKFHTSPKGKDDTDATQSFLSSVESFLDDDAFEDLVKEMPVLNRETLRLARRHVQEDSYQVRAFFVTTATLSPTRQARVQSRQRKLAHDYGLKFELIAQRDLATMAHDYQEDVINSVGEVPLQVDSAPLIHCADGNKLWSFVAMGSQVGDLVREFGDRIFDRNVRGSLGSKKTQKVNSRMLQTLKESPELFIFHNNGLTIACEDVSFDEVAGTVILKRPQIVNGQQTTRTLYESQGQAEKARVHVRAIEIARNSREGGKSFAKLLLSIVEATNSQTAIDLGDLRSNDSIQVALQREAAKFSYSYERKSGEKKTRGRRGIHRTALVAAVANSTEFALGQREGKKVYDREIYDRLFRSSSPEALQTYLAQYLLAESAHRTVKQLSFPSALNLLLIFDTWSEVGELISRRPAKFIHAFGSGSDGAVAISINMMQEVVATAGMKLYEREAEKSTDSLPPANFFRRQETYEMFCEFWHQAGVRTHNKYDSAKKLLATALR
jgi:hypothetical protein